MAETGAARGTAGPWVLRSATILASSMAFIDGSALNVALPAVQTGLHASGVQLLWVVNAYLLMLASLIPVGGSLGDVLGRKRRVFAIGIALFVVASLVCGLAPTSGFLIVARLVQGAGSALMIPGSLSIITAFYSPDKRGRGHRHLGRGHDVVTVVGPVLGGALADAGLWRVVFLINLPIGVTALVVLLINVPENQDENSSGRIDFLGAGLLAVGLAGPTYGLLSAPNLGFADPRAGGAPVGVLGLAASSSRKPGAPTR